MTDPGVTRIAVQRCDRFVARTMNWMYDHLRALPRYTPLVLTDRLENRDEFPDLEAWSWAPRTLGRRVWLRLGLPQPFPPDLRRVRSRDPKLLHSHFGYVAVGDHALRRALDVPWVVGFYGADVYELSREARWREKYARLFDAADRVLALGPRMRERLIELGCPSEKIAFHVLGVDVDAFPVRPRALQGGSPLRILFAGTFREKKGIPDLLTAVGILRDEGVAVHLDLVGDAAEKPGDQETKERILARLAALDLDPIVTRHRFLPFRDLMELALDCHVLVVPSVTSASGDAEGTPTVIQQVMATGMPVVATRHSDIPHTLGPLADRLVPERDPGALAEALRKYVETPDLLRADGMAFRRRAEGALDIRVAAGGLADVYDAVAG